MAFATALTRKNRLVSMLSDQVIMTMVMGCLWAPVFIYRVQSFSGTSGSGYFFAFQPGWNVYMAFVFSLYFNKDVYRGQSIGKRLLRFRVVTRKSGLTAGPLRCLARNLTLLIWPAELIAAMVDVRERLGDYIAGTRLENSEPEEAARVEWVNVVVSALAGMAVVYVVVVCPMESLIKVMARSPFSY